MALITHPQETFLKFQRGFVNAVHMKGMVCSPAETSVPSKAVCREIGPALRKIGSTDFVRMSKKDAFA